MSGAIGVNISCRDIDYELHFLLTRKINPLLSDMAVKVGYTASNARKRRRVKMFYNVDSGVRVEVNLTGLSGNEFDLAILEALFLLRDLLAERKITVNELRKYIYEYYVLSKMRESSITVELRRLLEILGCKVNDEGFQRIMGTASESTAADSGFRRGAETTSADVKVGRSGGLLWKISIVIAILALAAALLLLLM